MRPPIPRSTSNAFPLLRALGLSVLTVFLGTIIACRTVPNMKPVNLNAPGWTVRHGQAVWTAPSRDLEMAGELILATHDTGGAWLQFSKTPFTIAAAQRNETQWRVEFSGDRQFGGRRPAGGRFLWMQLIQIESGEEPQANWDFESSEDGTWTLRNSSTGEQLKGYWQ